MQRRWRPDAKMASLVASVPHLVSRAKATLLDDLPFAIWIARVPSGEVVYANEGFWSLAGREWAGSAVDSAGLFYDRQGNLYEAERLPFSRAVASGQPVVVDDLVVRRPDGGRVWL